MFNITEGTSVVSSNSQKSPASQIETKGSVQGDSLSATSEPGQYKDSISLPQSDISFASLQKRNDSLQQTARTIRATNKIFDNVAELIGEKREEIVQYEKQYPPFVNQSSERIEFLNSIAALKRQVDAVTLVPDNKELTSINPDQFSTDQKFFQQGALSLFSELQSGATGLNIASINQDATDFAVRKFANSLAEVSHKLETERARLAIEAERISLQLSSPGKGREVLENSQHAINKSEQIEKRLSQLPELNLGSEQGQKILEKLI